jgi:hypothetical protein
VSFPEFSPFEKKWTKGALHRWHSFTTRGDSDNFGDQSGNGKTTVLEFMERDFNGLTLQNEPYQQQQ